MIDAQLSEGPRAIATAPRAKPKGEYLDPTKAALAALALKQSIAAVAEGDDDLLADMIEGETELFDIVDRLLVRIAENGALAAGIGGHIEVMKDRQDRFLKRVAADRALITQALLIAELAKASRPIATLSISQRGLKLIVDDEASIPAAYWKMGDPKLDRTAVSEALKARLEAIEAAEAACGDDEKALAAALAAIPDLPGAHLEQAPPSLTIRER